MVETSTPLIADYDGERVFAWRRGVPVSAASALGDIQALAAVLAGRAAFFNVCDDRYLFTVLFAAGCVANAINLLPQSRRAAVLGRIRESYPEADAIDDAWVAAHLDGARSSGAPPPSIPNTRVVAVVYTSGSTGCPNPQNKRWGELAIGSALLRRRFFCADADMNIVASVPPQHMYGLENSVLLALHAGFAADSARPFMPWEIAEALERLPAPRALFITPIQLKACLEAGVSLAPLARIISATAPLSPALAARAEDAWGCPVHEIYGSSETGSIASRRSTAGTDWRLYNGLQLAVDGRTVVSGGHLPEPVVLDDALEAVDTTHFRLLGRASELIKVAGKRISLAELTTELIAIDGVADAVVFASPDDPAAERPTALVVAPGLDRRAVGAALAERVDPVFVPRPLLLVAKLPRNPMGKIARGDLVDLWRQARASARPADDDEFVVGRDDACLDGHFPDAPIVPGVVVLDRVEDALARRCNGRITRIVRCKFVAGLYPEQRCRVELAVAGERRFEFSCHGPSGVVATGVIEWEACQNG